MAEGKLTRPSARKAASERAAEKLEAGERRFLIRMTDRSYRAIRNAAFARDLPMKGLLLGLARDSGIEIDPQDLGQ
jgi:hypothetical protein